MKDEVPDEVVEGIMVNLEIIGKKSDIDIIIERLRGVLEDGESHLKRECFDKYMSKISESLGPLIEDENIRVVLNTVHVSQKIVVDDDGGVEGRVVH